MEEPDNYFCRMMGLFVSNLDRSIGPMKPDIKVFPVGLFAFNLGRSGAFRRNRHVMFSGTDRAVRGDVRIFGSVESRGMSHAGIPLRVCAYSGVETRIARISFTRL